MTKKTFVKLYRLAYIIGVALIIASLALMLPGGRNVVPASAQTGWSVTLYCEGFDLDAPVHPDITIRVQGREPGSPVWGYRQTFALGAGGPATYSFDFDPLPPPGSEVLIRVFATADDASLFNFKDDLPCGEVTPTNTPVTPTNTPVTPTNTPVTPTSTSTITIPTITNTPTDTPTETPTNTPTVTPTGTLPTSTPTVTGTPPTNTPTNTPTFTASPTVTGTPPTSTPTVTGTPPTSTPTVTGTPPTATPTVTGTPPTPTPTQTDVSSIPTPTPPRDPRPSNTPQSSIPSPAPQGTPGVLIPETGLDLNAQFSFLQRSLLNLGLGFLGIGLVLHGMALNAGRKED